MWHCRWLSQDVRWLKRTNAIKTGKTKFRVDGELRNFNTAFYRRGDLPIDTPIQGPAIVLQLDSTTVVPPNWSFTADAHGNLMLNAGDAK